MSDADAFYAAFNDRPLRYAGRLLDPGRRISITASPDYLARPEGQAAAIVAANLLGRMSPRVNLSFSDVTMALPKPWAGLPLIASALQGMRAVNPNAAYEASAAQEGDYRLHLGPDGAPWVCHGDGWRAYVGPAPSPLDHGSELTVAGAVFAVIAAVAEIFIADFPEAISRTLAFDTFGWTQHVAALRAAETKHLDLGKVLFVGAGSVGSAAAYFLVLLGATFEAFTVDMDEVKIENLGRSPVFKLEDCKKPKVEAISRFFASAGIETTAEPVALDEAALWRKRQASEPDLLIAAANERDVRREVETQLPPVQVYATTGRNWQVTLLRHIPGKDPCSCCVFGAAPPAPTDCATVPVTAPGPEQGEQVDASVPFLSFAAGFMAAVEAIKLRLAGYPFSANRVFYQPHSDDLLVARPTVLRRGCVCASRDEALHRQMIGGSRYAHLSDNSDGE